VTNDRAFIYVGLQGLPTGRFTSSGRSLTGLVAVGRVPTGELRKATFQSPLSGGSSRPIVVIRGPASERLLRTIPDVPINLLELNSRADASGKPGAAHFVKSLG